MCQGTEAKSSSQENAKQEGKRMISLDWILGATQDEPAFSRERLYAIIEIQERVKDHGEPTL
jgi:hypothetical protein